MWDGAGRSAEHPGGQKMIRELFFSAPMTVSMLYFIFCPLMIPTFMLACYWGLASRTPTRPSPHSSCLRENRFTPRYNKKKATLSGTAEICIY